jgi:hypothetical protein
MPKRILFALIVMVLVLLTAACDSASSEYVLGDTLLEEDFSETVAWENFTADDVDLRVSDGVYRAQTGPGGYTWGLNAMEHTDVVIEVTAEQASAYENNGYGVMCRADPNNTGDGYYFLISGDGFYSIRKGEAENVNPLVDWTAHSTINTGQGSNTIRAVCIGNYLALYVNDRFLTEIEDSGGYSSGYAGLSVAAFTDESADTTLPINADIIFDDLTIWAASLSN